MIAPPPLIALAAVLLGLALDWLLPAYVLTVLLTLAAAHRPSAVILFAGAAALAVPALRGFRSAGTHVEPWKPSTRAGDRRHFRLAAQSDVCRRWRCILAGLAILLASDWMLVMTVVFVAGHPFRRGQARGALSRGEIRRCLPAYKARVPRYGWPG